MSTQSTTTVPATAEQMNIVIAGHVDHGKSTIIGRMLADTGSLPEGKLDAVKATCERNSKPFEYAFLLDALKDEQAQGITIDAARVFFKSDKRHYIIIDAPGHIEFLKNMVTGASRAEAALLVIDAAEGVKENSRRHGYLLSMLGIQQIAVMVNKMDLVDYSEETYKSIVQEYTDFLTRIDVTPFAFVPVSGREGDNVAARTEAMAWYNGPTVLNILDTFPKEAAPEGQPFRMPVQDVYKFTAAGDDRRIVSGTVDSGSYHVGDEIVFYPSGKHSRVNSIEAFNADPPKSAEAGDATGFTLEEQIYVVRGEVACRTDEPKPEVATRIRVNLFWMGRDPLVRRKEYLLKVGTAKVPVRLEEIHRVIDASDLDAQPDKTQIDRHDVAEVTLKLRKPIAFDPVDLVAKTSRFVLVDNFEIAGGGIIREAVEDAQSWVRDKVLLRNYKWEASLIPPEHRMERYSQKPSLVLITGTEESARKPIAKELEEQLFSAGRYVYYLGIGNVLYGVDADIKGTKTPEENHAEHIRRVAEVAHIMLDAGVILVVTARELSDADLESFRTIVNPDAIEVVWIGDTITTDLSTDLHLPDRTSPDEAVEQIKLELQKKGVLFRPW